MIRALYSASSGLVAQSIKQDVIANNLANAQTSGFRRLRVTGVSFADELNGQMSVPLTEAAKEYPQVCARGSRVQVIEQLDTSYGPIEPTGSEFDVAIEGPGEFEIVSASGSRYTRSGSFRIGPNDELLTVDGAQVQGKSGPIRVPEGKFEVRDDGTIVVNGSHVDSIKIAGAQPGRTRVLQGHLEGSNVSSLTEMVDMIANMRAFEANQKVIQSVDHTLDKLINEAGRV